VGLRRHILHFSCRASRAPRWSGSGAMCPPSFSSFLRVSAVHLVMYFQHPPSPMQCISANELYSVVVLIVVAYLCPA
jgi:hypothetical protein